MPDDFEINIPEPYLIAMGKVTVAWGVLESVVDLAITRLAGFGTFDPRSAIMTAHMAWPQKMNVLESLAAALASEHPGLANFDAAKQPLKRAQEGRNQIAHGHWAVQDGKVYRLRATARGKLRADITPVTLSQIDAVLSDISRAGRVVLKVVFDAERPSGPDSTNQRS
jgi:hypothetical protein